MTKSFHKLNATLSSMRRTFRLGKIKIKLQKIYIILNSLLFYKLNVKNNPAIRSWKI